MNGESGLWNAGVKRLWRIFSRIVNGESRTALKNLQNIPKYVIFLLIFLSLDKKEAEDG